MSRSTGINVASRSGSRSESFPLLAGSQKESLDVWAARNYKMHLLVEFVASTLLALLLQLNTPLGIPYAYAYRMTCSISIYLSLTLANGTFDTWGNPCLLIIQWVFGRLKHFSLPMLGLTLLLEIIAAFCGVLLALGTTNLAPIGISLIHHHHWYDEAISEGFFTMMMCVIYLLALKKPLTTPYGTIPIGAIMAATSYVALCCNLSFEPTFWNPALGLASLTVSYWDQPDFFSQYWSELPRLVVSPLVGMILAIPLGYLALGLFQHLPRAEKGKIDQEDDFVYEEEFKEAAIQEEEAQ